MLSWLCLTVVLAFLIWAAVQISYQQKRAQLVSDIMARKRVTGEHEDITFAVERLMSEQEYLIQMLNGGLEVTFGAGGALTVSEMPEITVSGNVVTIKHGNRRLEVMKLDHLIRISKVGVRGGVGSVIEEEQWALLQALNLLKLIREDTD